MCVCECVRVRACDAVCTSAEPDLFVTSVSATRVDIGCYERSASLAARLPTHRLYVRVLVLDFRFVVLCVRVPFLPSFLLARSARCWAPICRKADGFGTAELTRQTIGTSTRSRTTRTRLVGTSRLCVCVQNFLLSCFVACVRVRMRCDDLRFLSDTGVED